ncbi:zonular occludens toxin domain-containing protein [Dickeya zeae]|uniref:Assembly protein n=1 Tax=Dickeya zeae TaxID=204042 RepID=A0ABX8VSX8_9GAMM|nr:zonular occludens toxin domain-containing protein [Dickeya zeae]QYM90984.1 assembly protein [Dickeya zeae]QYM90995.1 assembly protein [Dickeya zeae]
MAVYVVTGKLGSGKTLVAVGKIQEKIVSGCKVATNLDLRLHKLPRVGIQARSPRVLRIPDKPSLDDLLAIGKGNISYDEAKNGLLVLDECGTWFNSRSWADKDRQDVINWFLHARKLGWDIIFLIQDLSIMDKQARVALAEHVVYCRRLDRITLPFIGTLYSVMTGTKMPLPKIHIGVVKYGDSPTSLTVERWTYTGRDLYAAYDTKQQFSDFYACGTFSYLPPYLSHGRYACKKDHRYYMKITKIYFKRFSRIVCFLTGSILALGFTSFNQPDKPASSPVITAEPEKKNTDDLMVSELKITASRRFGGEAFYQFTDRKGQKYTSDDLSARGYKLFYVDSCNVQLLKGGKNEMVKC